MPSLGSWTIGGTKKLTWDDWKVFFGLKKP